ncbi:MAG TPA: NADH-quinone oxidoreductase subunit M [Cytophagaceae bacterium]
MMPYLLSLIVFLPVPAILLLLLIPQAKRSWYKYVTAVTTFFQMVFSVILYLQFEGVAGAAEGAVTHLQLLEVADWINLKLGSWGNLSIEYFLGVDGLNIAMILLSGIILFIGAISSFRIDKNHRAYHSLYLLLSTTIFGCFLSLDLFLFFIFFEFMLLPMYFLIGIWGGPRREYASIKFFIYTLFGSVFILLVIIGLYFSVIDPVKTAVNIGLSDAQEKVTADMVLEVQQRLGVGELDDVYLVHTFNLTYMTDVNNYLPGSVFHYAAGWTLFGVDARLIAFLALFIGFAIKLPVVPFHTWLPDAHVEAPTPVSVILAGVLLKIGGYGLMRIAYPVFPEGGVYFSYLIGLLGVVSIIYGAFNALAMKDLKKMIAYSSVSHMGFVLLGLASLTVEGVNGSIYQMFSHGLLSGLLFLIAGVLYDRTHDRIIENYRGLASKMPVYVTVTTVAFFASFGLPGFSGFIAEMLVLLGAFNATSINELLPRWMAIAATIGILLGAVYFLWTLQKMFFGRFWVKPGVEWEEGLMDLTAREKSMMLPLAILAITFGLFPSLLLDKIAFDMSSYVEAIINSGKANLALLLKNG